MEAVERRCVLILADISGYTRYMLANQTSAVHGQWLITNLIETLLKEVDIPLVLHGIEGDALFLSASWADEGDSSKAVLDAVRTKLDRFFVVFLEGIVRTAELTPCDCASCRGVEDLKLKIIVHSGRAVYHTIAGLAQVAGVDVILAHRLLKNSVGSNEYLLMTDAAYRDLGCRMEGEFVAGSEDCEGIGPVKTWVRLMGGDRERVRASRAQMAPEAFEADSRAYLVEMWRSYWKDAFGTLRVVPQGAQWPRFAAETWKGALKMTLGLPALLIRFPKTLAARRSAGR
jgi:hypothetical protein